MRIGINCSVLSSRLTGVGYFTLALVNALTRFAKGPEYVLLGIAPDLDGLATGENVRLVPGNGSYGLSRVIWEQRMLPALMERENIQILHCPDFSRPTFTGVPIVNTLHDLSYYSARFFPITKLAYKRALTRVSIWKSKALVADSEYTRAHIIEKFSVNPAHIRVIYPGVEIPTISAPIPPVRPFVLFIGTLESRKNVKRLVEAFSQLKKRHDLPHRLVLAGQPGHGWAEIASAVQQSSVRDQIDVVGYLSRTDINRLYRSADIFVFPSLFEGFGLPVLEAMACGLPVVCSRATSLPEAGGDAAVYVDPESTEEMKDAMDRVLSSPELRMRMREEGLKQASRFSWQESARRYSEVYSFAVQN